MDNINVGRLIPERVNLECPRRPEELVERVTLEVVWWFFFLIPVTDNAQEGQFDGESEQQL